MTTLLLTVYVLMWPVIVAAVVVLAFDHAEPASQDLREPALPA